MSVIVHGSTSTPGGENGKLFKYLSGTVAQNNLEYQFTGDIGTKVNFGNQVLGYDYTSIDLSSTDFTKIYSTGVGSDFNFTSSVASSILQVGNTLRIYGNTGQLISTTDMNKFYLSRTGISTTQNKNPYYRDFVCYGNGKYIAINTNSNAVYYYSTDGVNFVQKSFPSSRIRSALCYANGKFICISYTNSITYIAYSTDGINWTETSVSASYISDVAYGNNKFVAISKNNAVITSTDGVNWTVSTPNINLSNFNKVKYANGRFICWNHGANYKYIYESTDGTTWTQRNIPYAYVTDIDYYNGTYIYITSNNNKHCYKSSDLITWTAVALPTQGYWRTIMRYNNQWLIMNNLSGCPGIFLLSSDGVSWTSRGGLIGCSAYNANINIRGAEVIDNKLIILEASMFSIFDVSNYTPVLLYRTFAPASFYYMLKFNNKLYATKSKVSSSGEPVYYTSINGIDWTPSSITFRDSDVDKALYFKMTPDALTINCRKTTLYVSTDGQNWTANDTTALPEPGSNGYDIYFYKGKYYNASGYYSTDLSTWTSIASDESYITKTSGSPAFVEGKIYQSYSYSSGSNYSCRQYYSEDYGNTWNYTQFVEGGSGYYYPDYVFKYNGVVYMIMAFSADMSRNPQYMISYDRGKNFAGVSGNCILSNSYDTDLLYVFKDILHSSGYMLSDYIIMPTLSDLKLFIS